jgi:hypothetical protein
VKRVGTIVDDDHVGVETDLETVPARTTVNLVPAGEDARSERSVSI